ncbi:hypothetical protein KR222_001609, partial [Zaprionus bogoriensis]
IQSKIAKMGLEYCNEPADWRDSPFLVVLFEYTVKNVGMPTDMGILIAYVLLFLITWYAIIWLGRFLFSLVWPVIIVVSALFLFRFLRTFQVEDLADMVLQVITMMADAVILLLQKILELLSGLC